EARGHRAQRQRAEPAGVEQLDGDAPDPRHVHRAHAPGCRWVGPVAHAPPYPNAVSLRAMLDPRHLPLIGDRTRLRALRHEDAAAYAAGTADPEVRRFAHLPEPEYTEDSVVALVDGPVRDGRARGDLAVLAIADVATSRFAGSVVLFDVDAATAEVGFWVHPDHRGRVRRRGARSRGTPGAPERPAPAHRADRGRQPRRAACAGDRRVPGPLARPRRRAVGP